MSSDIYTGFDSDNLVGFNYDNLVGFSFSPSFDHHYPYDDFLLRAVSGAGSPPENLPLPRLHGPPSQFQEPLVFSSYFARYGDAEEGSMQRSYSRSCMGAGDESHVYRGGCGGGEGLIRKVYSTGDLQKRGERYSAEERKERIRKYREKRNFRNFNKTIKYACRKTLADSRPRIRGRFARNDDVVGVDDTSNDIAITLPTLRGHDHDHRHVESSSLWQWDHLSKEYNYGYVKGGDAFVTSLFLPQNYY